jgi:bifunctional non-homologous end joining protein LigD
VTHPKLTHPEKVLYPEAGVTKGDLFDYYRRVARWMLPHVARRPLTLRRCPEDWHAGFFQQHARRPLPQGLRTVDLVDARGPSHRITLDDETGLLALVQMNALEIHAWNAHVDDVDKPDVLVFDLDPGPGVAFGAVVAAARAIRQRLGDARIESFVKTTGGKGLHVCVAIERTISWERARTFTRELAEGLARDEPGAYVTTVSKAKRPGKILIDFFRNGKGATIIAPYSTRARAGAPVAVPVAWEELDDVGAGNAFSLASTLARLEAEGDAWAPMLARPQRVPP